MTLSRQVLDKLEIDKWLSLNAKLQQKKNDVRAELKEKGVLKRDGNNSFDKYKYFSEAQYKILFTQLLSEHKLELTAIEDGNTDFKGTDKMPFGNKVCLCFRLTDVETGFFEESYMSGVGIDKGDKGIYKAYTGALKYYLANNFMVATGDDPEKNDTRPLKRDEDYYVCENCSVSEFGDEKRTAKQKKAACVKKFGQALCPNCAKEKEAELKAKAEQAKFEEASNE